MSVHLNVMDLLLAQFLRWAVGGFLLFMFHTAGCCGCVVVILCLGDFGFLYQPEDLPYRLKFIVVFLSI